jgi:hypothetical protein
MGTPQTPIQRSLSMPAVPIADANAGSLDQVAKIADTVGDFAVHQLRAQNADRLNTVALGATKDLDDLALSLKNDPEPATAAGRFADQAAQIHDKAAGQLSDPESRASFQQNFGHLVEARRIGVASDALQVQTEDAAANVVSSLDEYTKQAAAAPNANARHAIMTQASDALEKAVTTRIMRAGQAQKLGKDFKQRLSLLDARRAIDTDPVQGVKMLRANAFPDLDPLEAERQIERGEAEILSRQREAHAAMRDARADARSSLEDLETINRSGLPISQAAADSARHLVAASGDKAIADRYGRVVRVSNFLTGLRGATPGQVQDVVTNLEGQAASDGANATMAAGVIAARQYAQAQASGLREDPLMYAQGQGRATINTIKLDGSATADEWKSRVQQADRVAGYYGTKPTYLTKDETTQLAAVLAPGQPVNARLQVAGSLVKALGPKALSVFASIAPNDPVLGNAGALMVKGNITAARDAMTGQGLLHSAADGKQSDLRPTTAGRNQLPLVSDLSVATGIAGARGRGQVLSTADAIAAVRLSAKGLTGADVGNGNREAVAIYEGAVHEAAGATFDDRGTQWGGLTTYNGVPVIAPNGITANSFEDAVQGLSDRALTTHSVSGAPPMIGDQKLAAKDLGKLYTISVGDGLYSLSTTDPRKSVTPIHDAKGRLYKFSLLNAFDHVAPAK